MLPHSSLALRPVGLSREHTEKCVCIRKTVCACIGPTLHATGGPISMTAPCYYAPRCGRLCLIVKSCNDKRASH